jgi:hypothetical protein
MTVDKLISDLLSLKQTNPELGGYDVVIPLHMASIGATMSVNIKQVSGGIDFDYDKIFLSPDENLIKTTPTTIDWTEDFPYENGNYSNICVSCGKEFIGHKYRRHCKLCSHNESILK